MFLKGFIRILFSAGLATQLAVSTISQCLVAPDRGVMADDWDQTFIQYGPGKGLEPKGSPGWIGGDATFSLLLPNGDSAFFFSDSYIGEWPAAKGDGTVKVRGDGARVIDINCGPPICDPPVAIFSARNSVVVRRKDGKRLNTLVGTKNENELSTSFFASPSADIYYWMGDQILLRNKKIAVFLHKFDAKLEFHGASVAQLDAATFKIEKITDAPLPNNVIHWGSSLLSDNNGWLYIYGKGTVAGKKLPFVSRVKNASDTAAIADTSKWETWNGRSWTKDLKAAAPIVSPEDSISDEFSVRRFNINGRPTLIMVGLDSTVPFYEWRDITLYSACDPQGPFDGKHRVYSMPESASKTVWGTRGPIPLKSALVVYNPHIHSQFTKGNELLISYNPNRIDNADSIYIDGYRPRFIRVRVAGLSLAK